jgi:hypothetical protein
MQELEEVVILVTRYETAYLQKRILSESQAEEYNTYEKELIKVFRKEMSKGEISAYENKYAKTIRVVLQSSNAKLKDADSYDTLLYNNYSYAIVDIQEISSSRKLGAKEYLLILN